ncbi:MAG: sugar ABC transporter ATP-binding protein [Rhodococcus sp. (in: high G+C Gram-positive bacteria)]
MSVPSATTSTPLLEVREATKSFGSIAAVSGVSFPLYAGEAHALVGENGAGKSTIVKMLAGVHKPDTGSLLIGGSAVTLNNPAEAKANGIAVIYQEPTLFPDLTIAENIYIGAQPKSRGGMIDRRAMNAAAEVLFGRLGVPMDPDRLASGLSIADQQLVEIAKALSTEASVIVMDEPTAALSGNEVERLFKVARSLCADGAAVLFISHRFEEIFALCQRVTVMRDGKHISTAPLADQTVDDLIKQMVGRELGALFPKLEVEPGAVVLEVENLTRAGVFTDIGFKVRAGEIVALAGLVGAGRSEVMQAVFGVDPRDSGEVKVRGKILKAGNPKAAMRAGIALVPEDRRQQGLVPDMSIERNATLTRSAALSRFGFLVGGSERRSAYEWTKKLQTKFASITDPVGTLSGGNQQKVVLAKWLATDPIVLVVDEPTRGIDVGTKAEVHKIISRLASEGVAVVMISSELPEVLGMADRVLVMREGRIVAEIDRAHATEETVMFAAMGSEAAA